MPPELDPLFRAKPRHWVAKILGGRYVAVALRTRRIGSLHAPGGDGLDRQVLGKVHYMLKCAPARLEGQLGLQFLSHAHWGQECLVYGERAGVWQRSGRGSLMRQDSRVA